MSAPRADRSWLRVDRGLETYSLQGPDSPRLPHQQSEYSFRLSTAPHGGMHLLRRIPRESVKPLQRWWLRDLSMSSGVYEVLTGLVSLYSTPDARAPCLGAIRAGTRFHGTPFMVQNRTWIKVKTTGVSPPMFTNRSDVSLSTSDLAVHRLYAAACTPPLAAMDDLEQSEEIWVEHNIAYIQRIRDLKKEKGIQGYHMTASPENASRRHRAASTGRIAPLETMRMAETA
eukprot:TRINITY_DN112767_c0_g1_i1.p1 TRINITY_DN112767_c0_g1~~TRINITY_DN112767_c0_g1_i1.p1  ORF type:complete len:229 (+),score=26.18 TRINITY_DN112767_c0_g1_i1:28-714(+)